MVSPLSCPGFCRSGAAWIGYDYFWITQCEIFKLFRMTRWVFFLVASVGAAFNAQPATYFKEMHLLPLLAITLRV
jgi:hypothetical protein